MDSTNSREPRMELRGAVYRADAGSLVAILGQQDWPDHSLQLIGDGLLAVLAEPAEEVEELARRCVRELRDRDWEGDDELADALDAALGAGAVPPLRGLPVDLEELAGVLEGDRLSGGGRIDLRTGEVWPQPAIEYAEEMGEDLELDDERWLWVACEGSRAGYRDMERFITEVDDPGKADRLSIAIEGRGAFRRFKDVLSRWPALSDRWYAFSEDRQRGRARAWLAMEGYTPQPRHPEE